MIEVGLVSVQGLQLPFRMKGLNSKERVKLFFICCQRLEVLLLFMSATMDAFQWALKLFSKVHNRKDVINWQL